MTDDRFGDNERTNLTMKAFYASSNEPVTRSDNPDEVMDTVTQDTLYINDITYLTAEVSDMIHDMPFGAKHPITADTTALTRGTPIDKSEDLTSLNLVMFKTQSNDFDPTSSAATDLFTVTANKGDFILNKSYAWTAGIPDKHTFIAFSPKTGQNGVTLSANQKSLTYTASTTASDHPDICVSDISRNSNVVNTIGSNNHNQRFYMKHALVAIGFEAAGYDVKITKVTIKGAHTTGTLDLITQAWSSLGGVESRDAGIKEVWLTSDYGSQMSNITNTDGYLMMIPQALDNLELIMTFEGRNQQVGGSYTIKLKDLGTQWTAGKKIIYQLRLKSKPAVENNALTIADPRAGYTNSAPLSIAASTDDNLTFSWAESWLRIHRGNPGYVNPQSGGASSGWVTGVNNWKNIYFFSSADNPSSNAARTATVTVSGKKSGKRTFTITQEKMLTLALSANGPGETIPATGKTYTIGVTSNTTWIGKEQTGATLSPASGNGNNSSVRIVVPKGASWKNTPVKITVATTNTVGPQLTRTWTGTRPGVPFQGLTSAVSIGNYTAGTVATTKPQFKAAPDDELTFTWSESWLKVYSGNRVNTVNPANTGSGSGFKATAAQWNNLWFFASNNNNSVNKRKATVTVRGKAGTTHTFTVEQSERGFTIKDAAYIDCAGRYTSTDLGADAAPDDEITVTWDWEGSWLGLCVLSFPADNVSLDVGEPMFISGKKISGRDFGRIRFAAWDSGTETVERSVIVKFTNKNGITRNVNVTQIKGWSLVSSGGISLPFSTGYSANEATSSMRIDLHEDPRFATNNKQINVFYNNNNGPSRINWFDQGWVRVTNPALNANSTLSFKRNIHPFGRSATIRYEVYYKGATKSIEKTVTQAAADAWYIYEYDLWNSLPMGTTPTMLVAKEEIGNHYWGELWRCRDHYGSSWTLPSQNEFLKVVIQMRDGFLYWGERDSDNAYRVPFRDDRWHWTRETGGTAFQRYSIYYKSSNYFKTKSAGSVKEYNRPYRCVRNW